VKFGTLIKIPTHCVQNVVVNYEHGDDAKY
jgi:hypothetical protein